MINDGVKVNAILDDKAHVVAKFIQEISKIQDQRFETLLTATLENNWVEGMGEEDLRDWLFDYVFNGYDFESREIESSFSEYIVDI